MKTVKKVLRKIVPVKLQIILIKFLQEIDFHRQRIFQKSNRKRVSILPSQGAWAASSNLRAYQLAKPLKKLGWRVTIVPPTASLTGRLRMLSLESPDILLMQQSRHPLNRPSLYPYPTVYDIDDADYLDPNCKDDVIACATDSKAVVAGSRYVAELLFPYSENIFIQWTTTPHVDSLPEIQNGSRLPVIAWAHASPLGFPDERVFLRNVLLEVSKQREYIFWLFGTEDELDAEAQIYFAPLKKRGIECVRLPWMPYNEYLKTLEGAAIGLQHVSDASDHSRGRSFGKILAYLQKKVVVVASNNVDHPLFFRNKKNGILANNLNEWVKEIVWLLDNPKERESISETAYSDFCNTFTTDVAATNYDKILRSSICISPK